MHARPHVCIQRAASINKRQIMNQTTARLLLSRSRALSEMGAYLVCSGEIMVRAVGKQVYSRGPPGPDGPPPPSVIL